MPDSISTLALRVDSQSAVSNLNKFGVAATALGGTTDALKGKLLQLGAAFLSLNFGRQLVAEAAEGQEAFGKYEAVLGRLTKNADKLTAELRESFNFSTTAAQASISAMTDTFAKSGLELKQAFDFTSDLQKRAADLEAFTNAEGGVAAVSEALTKGIIGNYMALRTLGIVINADMLKTQMLEDKQKGLKFSTENAAKMHARYVLILKQSQSAAGQVARESDNFSNRLRRLRAITADLRKELGDVLIPVATKLVVSTDKVVRAFEGMSDRTKTFVVVGGATLGLMAALAPKALQIAANFLLIKKNLSEGTVAQEANTAATIEGTTAKEAETAARLANANAINAENAALRSQVGSKVTSNLGPVGKTSSSETKFGPILSKAEKRELKMAWRAQTEGARKFSRLPGAMTATELGKSVGKKTLGKGAGAVGMFANLTPMFSKLVAPLGKFSSSLGKTFSTILKHVPLITRFSGVLGKALGLFGTAGAVVGGVVLALQAFKNAPQWLEQFLDSVGPKIMDFGKKIPDYLWAGITGGAALAKKGAESAGKLVVDAMVGGAQFGKRLLGFETEASRAYKLNKQIEENNRKRAELLEVQQKQLAAENAVLDARKSVEQAKISADLEVNATKETEAVKLEKTERELQRKRAENEANKQELDQLAMRLATGNLSNSDRSEIEERSKTLSDTLSTGFGEEKELAKKVIELQDSVHSMSKAWSEDQDVYARAKKDSALDLENARGQIAFDNANDYNSRQTAMKANAERTRARLEASISASEEADAINEQIETINNQLDSGSVARALSDLEELAESGDLSDNALIKFAGATNALEQAGYNVGDKTFGAGVSKQILEQITDQRKGDTEKLRDLTRQRDDKWSLASERSSLEQELASQERDIANAQKERTAAQKEEKRANEERQRQQARSDAAFQRGIGETYFARQLSAVDLFYGDNRLGASQARYNLIGQRGFGDWNDSLSALYGQQTKIDALAARLSVLNEKNSAGTLTDDEAKQRDLLRSQIETLRGEYDSDYQNAIQRRLATEDELLGLENAMREEYLSEAQKWIDETTGAWKEQLTAQAQAAEEAQRKRLEERSRVEEEARQAVSGMRAITSGSSEAFNIASRIYNRGQEDVPTEKKIESSTKQIETVVKAMQEQMMSYFREQTTNGLTLSMGY